MLIVTGIEVFIENCLPVYLAPLSKYGTSKIMGSWPWLLGSHDVIGHVSIQLAVVDVLWVLTMRLSGFVMEIWCLKDNGVTTLTFLSHVMSSVMYHSTRDGRLPMGGP